MKRLVLITLILLGFTGARANSFSCGFDGIGLASRYNYDYSYSYGLYYYKGVGKGIGFGAQEIYQYFNVYYDDERFRHTGTSIRNQSYYYFFSPMFVFQTGRSGQNQCYFTGGIGQLKGGNVTMRKWSNVPSTNTLYDSTIDQASTLQGFTFRVGMGFSQFYYLGGNFHLMINEDLGVMASSICDVGTGVYSSVRGDMSQFFRPTYFTLRLGLCYITHSKNRSNMWRIYR